MNVGDTVYLLSYHFGKVVRIVEAKIVRATPGGQLVLDNGKRLKNGRIVGEGFSYSGSTRITTDMEEVEEARASIAKLHLINRLLNAKWSQYPLETLQAVAALLSLE